MGRRGLEGWLLAVLTALVDVQRASCVVQPAPAPSKGAPGASAKPPPRPAPFSCSCSLPSPPPFSAFPTSWRQRRPRHLTLRARSRGVLAGSRIILAHLCEQTRHSPSPQERVFLQDGSQRIPQPAPLDRTTASLLSPEGPLGLKDHILDLYVREAPRVALFPCRTSSLTSSTPANHLNFYRFVRACPGRPPSG